MLSIFVETSCNRYNRDECISCHVYEPLMEHPVSDWHLTVEQAIKISKYLDPEKTFFTHTNYELEYEETNRTLPDNIEMAYDGLRFQINL